MYSAFGIKKIGSHCITRYTAVDALRRFVFVCFVYTFPKKKKKEKHFVIIVERGRNRRKEPLSAYWIYRRASTRTPPFLNEVLNSVILPVRNN